jgi:hypothetical protein
MTLEMKTIKPREVIKQAHEDSVIELFLEWYNAENQTQFTVINKPEPPDAIVQYGNKTIWIEHADIYRSTEEAREERSAVTPGETPYYRQEHPIHEPDIRIAFAFISILKKKLLKDSYEKWFKIYGPGILILTERDPLFSQSTWDCITEKLESESFQNDKGYFETVYLGYRSMNSLAFMRVDY